MPLPISYFKKVPTLLQFHAYLKEDVIDIEFIKQHMQILQEFLDEINNIFMTEFQSTSNRFDVILKNFPEGDDDENAMIADCKQYPFSARLLINIINEKHTPLKTVAEMKAEIMQDIKNSQPEFKPEFKPEFIFYYTGHESIHFTMARKKILNVFLTLCEVSHATVEADILGNIKQYNKATLNLYIASINLIELNSLQAKYETLTYKTNQISDSPYIKIPHEITTREENAALDNLLHSYQAFKRKSLPQTFTNTLNLIEEVKNSIQNSYFRSIRLNTKQLIKLSLIHFLTNVNTFKELPAIEIFMPWLMIRKDLIMEPVIHSDEIITMPGKKITKLLFEQMQLMDENEKFLPASCRKLSL